MANIDNPTNSNKKRKWKPAGKDCTPKICAAQFVKGKEKKLEALESGEIAIPKELMNMSIEVYNGGIENDRTNA